MIISASRLRTVVVAAFLAFALVGSSQTAAHADDSLQATISSSSGRNGLTPLISSIDGCPQAPDGQVGYAWIQVTPAGGGDRIDSTDIALDAQGGWRWSSYAYWYWVPGSYSVSISCRYGTPNQSANQLTVRARYLSLHYTVEDTSLAPLTVAPSMMTQEGVLHVASSVPCPAGNSWVTVSSYNQSVTIETGTTSTQVQTDADGQWDAYLDYRPITGRLWSRKAAIIASCHSASYTASDVPRLEYGWAYLPMKLPAVRSVALGDSYSSGEGNPKFDAATGKCDVSQNSAWPELLDAKMGADLDLVKNLACSGGTTDALYHSFKSQKPQLNALAGLNPGVVTITIGGNDIGFADILANCYKSVRASSGCDRNGTLDKANKAVTALGKRLPGVYRDIKARVSPGTALVVVGYPQIFPSKQKNVTHCAWLSDGERKGLNKLAANLKRTTFDAAVAADPGGFEFVNEIGALKGHELCTKDAWVYPLKPTGGDLRGHPTKKGQDAMATYVQDYIEPESDKQFCGDDCATQRQRSMSRRAASRAEASR